MRENKMKKLLGVSIAAMLAVTPMLANATDTYSTVTLDPDSHIATTSYVQGAYNALIANDNALDQGKQDKLYTGSGNNTASINANVATTVRAATGDDVADNTTLVTEAAVRAAIDAAATSGISGAAGDGLAWDSTNNQFDINYDNSTIDLVASGDNAGKLEVKAGGITATQLATNAVETAKINAKAVTTEKINDKAVTAAQIADNTITASQIANATITSTQLAADSVTSTQIADGAVGLAKIASGDKQNATDTTTYTNTKLANAAYVDETVATAVANKATKSGVTETINQSTVTVYTTWGNLSNTQTVSLNGHAYAEPAPAQQTEP